ncbi:hypothetical protein BGZ57DRAFT_1016907 [Hyaloscypha finlandica]|nr:hypothetical protein BGZ57DRAFT_1016907 [Hyaloscypha finlandica]
MLSITMMLPYLSTGLLLFSAVSRPASQFAAAHGTGFRIRSSPSQDELNIQFACGVGVGSCPAGQCCSSGGLCGTGTSYCEGPDCQLDYGPACDGNIPPPGSSTLSVPRPLWGNQVYGGRGLFHCQDPGTIALTFDDGPYLYTQTVLDTLQRYNATATFFITGNNIGKGRIDDPTLAWPGILRNMYAAGHQLASHTWTHQDLSVTNATNIFGWFPTYMRPPFTSCSYASGCEDHMAALGYHMIYLDIDTKDYLNDSPDLIQKSKDYFSGNVSGNVASSSYLTLTHDTHFQTAINLTEFMLQTLQARGFRAVSVGECLGDPKVNCVSSLPTALVITKDGSCSSRSGGSYTCKGSAWGDCCSAYGWCGKTSAYCSGGCLPSYGTCALSTGVIVSTNGMCGSTVNQTCLGSTYGNCCSKYGFCGSTTTYCTTGCQAGFGTCS